MDIFFFHQLLKQRVAPVTTVSPAQQYSGTCNAVPAEFPKPWFYQIGWPGAGGHRRSLLGAHEAAHRDAAGVPPQ